MIKVLLWDIDGTVLDFLASERYAVKKCFEIFGIGECSDEMVDRYSLINKKYWTLLESGKITKPDVLRMRFEEFFISEGIDFSDIDGNKSEDENAPMRIITISNSKDEQLLFLSAAEVLSKGIKVGSCVTVEQEKQ